MMVSPRLRSELPRWFEWGVMFILIPLLLLAEPVTRLAMLAVATLYAAYIILTEKAEFKTTDRRRSPTLSPLVRIPILVGSIFLFSWLAFPETFLNLPELHPGMWLLILLFYPLLSALPQEFLYRRFYFWRYATLFPDNRVMLGSNVLLFAFVHVIYGNSLAVLMSLLGGAIFALSYQQSGRLLPVWIEHSIYGLAIFTSGLGQFFHIPVS